MLGALAFAATAMVAVPAEAVLTDVQVAFYTWQSHWDRPVQVGEAARSWTWGAEIAGAPVTEPYVGAEAGRRDVRYFDKARMEYWPNQEGSVRDVHASPWKVTTGLLATELMTGKLQLGDTEFEQRTPSDIPVAGDPDSGDFTPSYADLGSVMGYKPIPTGWTIIQTIDANGSVGADQRFAAFGVTAKDVESPTGHTVASVFWDWMNQMGVIFTGIGDNPWVTEQLFPNPFYATGYPTTEAYWTRTRVGGVEKDVLVQCFERRCMTYTPSSPDPWQVEMGNVGQHYYQWRYGG